jgi:hypothetical protein
VAAVRRLLATAAALCLMTPAAALASGDDVIKDCGDDGHLSKKYSQKEYSDALGNIPTDVDEYTDCRDVIRRAQLGDTSGTGSSAGAGAAGVGGPGSGGGVGGSGSAAGGAADPLAAASPEERAAIEKARSGGGKPVKIAGRLVQPGNLGFSGLNAIDTVPTPLLIVLIVAALAAGGAGGALLQRRVHARRAL